MITIRSVLGKSIVSVVLGLVWRGVLIPFYTDIFHAL